MALSALAALSRYAPIVEAGAGMGYWSALLSVRGVDVVGYDQNPPGAAARNKFHGRRRPWSPVRAGSSVEAVRRHPHRTLLLCWPPFDDDAASYAPLRAYPGDTLLYIGDAADGATATVRFHRELALNWRLTDLVDLPRWPGLADQLWVYRRSQVRRPPQIRDRCHERGRFITTGAIGRCDWCFRRHPPALAMRVGGHRLEYPQQMLGVLPPALIKAFRRSPNRIR